MLQSLSDVSELYRSHHQNSSLVTDHSSLACELAFVVRGVEMTFGFFDKSIVVDLLKFVAADQRSDE
jgi:hypothetical protein